MRISLRVEAGPHEGQVFEFEGHSNFVVGRSPKAHFRLPEKDKYFSRIHFMIEVNPPLGRLMDMGSTNGTQVNGTRVTSADLKDGDLIKAGITALRVSLTGHDGQTDPAPEDVTAVREAPVDESGMMTATLDTRVGHLPDLIQSLAARPPRPDTADPVADSCHLCSAPLPATATGPTWKQPPSVAPALCPACLDESHEHPQPIAGYRVVRELGRGGMGVVYLALRDLDGHRIAVKMIRPAVAVTERETLKFLREASILGELDHPNIVAFREMGESSGVLHFAMDYVDGSDASRLQKRHGGPLPIPRAVGLVCQMLQALDYAHAKGFVHRDIKPANLLISQEGGREVVKLTDFGLARVYQSSKMSGLTMKGDLGGTLAFMAPEQITELREARPPVDQYSAGATLYKLLTDRYIYDLEPKIEKQIMKILLEAPVPIHTRRPDIPEGLSRTSARCGGNFRPSCNRRVRREDAPSADGKDGSTGRFPIMRCVFATHPTPSRYR